MTPSVRRGGFAGPILLIGLGVLLLLSNLGVISESIWPTLLQMWPVVLIVFGLDILIGRRSIWGSLLLAVLILAVLAGGYWLSTVSTARAGPESVERVTVPSEGATQADVSIRPAVGALRVEAGSSGGPYLEASVPLLPGEKLGQKVAESGSSVSIDLQTEGIVVLPVVSVRGQAWIVRLNPDLETELTLGMGAGEIRVDGADLRLTALDADLGVGQIILELGPEVRRVDVESGIGRIVIVVPAGALARIDAEVALGDVDVPDGYRKSGDAYVSPGWTSSSTAIEISANQAIGQILIQQAP
ncbi:MAG TPA: DUF5668 domain-containing protein [Anaerolineales bacterium]|nr:DUF5668 domain-containing protein [Anaerolineales bacterium]